MTHLISEYITAQVSAAFRGTLEENERKFSVPWFRMSRQVGFYHHEKIFFGK